MNGQLPAAADARLLELVGDVCGLLDLDELRRGLLYALHRMLPSDWVSLNDLGPGPEDVVVLIAPDASEELFEAWARNAHQNPLLERYLRTGEGRALRFSDVCTREHLHGLALYREVYEPMGVEHQLAFTLPGGPQRVLAVALSRGSSDYSDAERDLADRARPFLIQAYLNAIAFDASRDRPEPEPTLEALVGAGLTPREAQSLRLVALGRSNHHVAEALGISHRTVGKHLERGFRKLDVHDRSSAAARVWELARGDGRGQAASSAQTPHTAPPGGVAGEHSSRPGTGVA
jgi:DNA-binding CsgD family transcriptional regulator